MARSKKFENIEAYMTSPEGLEELTKLARKGHTLEEIAHRFEMTRNTLYVWSKKHPEIQSALDEGKKVADDRVEQSLYESCFGRTEKTVVVEKDGDGNIVRQTVKTQYVPPSVTAIQYWLSNRSNGKWKARQQLEVTGDENLPLIIRNDLNPKDEESK